jgi:surface-anchored protein
VFRSKAVTTATGLTKPYPGPHGGLGGAVAPDADWQFDSLTTRITASPTLAIGSTNFFVTPASGSGYNRTIDPTQPDLGIRTRFRDHNLVDADPNSPNYNPNGNQFANFRMTLNVGASTLPGEFALFNSLGDLSPNTVRLNTATNSLSTDWPVWGHTHWHFGFSELGDYELVFTVVGLDTANNPVTAAQSFTLGFQVIPEPSTVALALGAVAIGAVALRRRK